MSEHKCPIPPSDLHRTRAWECGICGRLFAPGLGWTEIRGPSQLGIDDECDRVVVLRCRQRGRWWQRLYVGRFHADHQGGGTVMKRVRVDIPDSALDAAVQTSIKALRAENRKLQQRVAKLEQGAREAGRIREGLRIIEDAASQLRAEGFADWWD